MELDEACLNGCAGTGGGSISTTGAPSSGLQYLRGTLAKRAFPEIWDAWTFLLGHKEAEGIYRGAPNAWGEWEQFRLVFEVTDRAGHRS